ncbi:MAG: hypothetical protein ABI041_20195, partial [Bdellovibrionia bacterium]
MTSRFGVFVLGISLSLHLTTLSFAEESAPAESDSQDIVAVKSLEIALRRVEEDARTRRVWGGGLMLGLGAASAIGGVVAAVAGATAEVPISLGVTAVVLGGSGAFTRVSPTDQETLPLRFREMSENTHEKLAEKRLLGESYLTIFGYQAKRNRLIGSAMNIILGTV